MFVWGFEENLKKQGAVSLIFIFCKDRDVYVYKYTKNN